MDEIEALDISERRWRFVGEFTMLLQERVLIEHLARAHGSGVLLA